MPVHVYEIKQEDKTKIEKVLSYDPYLDPTIISKDDKDTEKTSSVQKENSSISKIEEMKKNDPYFDIIFVRQEYLLLDGSTLSLDPNKCYVYLKASEDFLAKADLKLEKLFPDLKRASKEIEEQIIEKVAEQQSKAESGFGFIFGN